MLNLSNTIKYAKAGIVGLTTMIPLKPVEAAVIDAPKIKTVAKFGISDIEKNFDLKHPSFANFLEIQTQLVADIQTGMFHKALNENKANLKKDLNLSEEKFNLYKSVINEIGVEEHSASSLTDPGCYHDSYDLLDEFGEVIGGDKIDKINPIYMERFEIKKLKDSEKQLFARYNIPLDNTKKTPRDYAIGAIIHLAEIDKLYGKYLNVMKKLKPDMEDKGVQASIRNAKRIMNDEVLSQVAIDELDTSHLNMSFVFGDIETPFKNLLTEKDMEDLRIYARTIVLSNEEFLIEKWDRHPVIPYGKNCDRACANVLSYVAE